MTTILNRRRFAQSAGVLLGAAGLLGAGGQAQARQTPASGRNTALPAPDASVHVLNRTGYGISDEDVWHVQAIGTQAYIEEQLFPEQIDDTAVEAYIIQTYPELFLDAAALFALPDEQIQQAARALKAATLFRRWFSRRQLYEAMVEFWGDHFSIYQDSGPLRLLKIIDDRTVVRPHALGYFRDLLHASAKSPAMLFYLDNYRNVKDGPNENYARELMELHTLGVDGGFTEQDVLEVARCFTGWTIRRTPAGLGDFVFVAQAHDEGEKTVLGVTIPAGRGIEDGEQVLDILAAQPATAVFIATKLCRRFVSDQPPQSLIDDLAYMYEASGGDIRSMMYTLLLSAEFMAAADAKFKRPAEFLGGIYRNLQPSMDNTGGRLLIDVILSLGHAPFSWEPPNGYPDVMAYWATTNGLLERWNFAIGLGENTLPGIEIELSALIALAQTPEQLVDLLAAKLLRRPLSDDDRNDLIAYAASGELNTQAKGLIGLMLASGYFQMR